jgi:iron(II)-dependent oxidoreductase
MHEDGATPEGLEDMAGNVYEWTRDRFVPYGSDPARASAEPRYAVRGGSWHSPPEHLRCCHRKGLFPETRQASVGFRCVLPCSEEG